MKRLACLSAVLMLVLSAGLSAEDKKEDKKPKQKQQKKVVKKKLRFQAIQGRPAILPITRAYYGPNKIYLLRRPDVQKEVKLDEDQVTEVTEAEDNEYEREENASDKG